jgi:Icc-related predicted phosphoesterase
MRVLAIADAPPLVLPRAVDAVLWLGDLEPAWLDGLAELEVPKLGVHGNHDPPGRLADFGVRDVHLRQEPLGDLSVTGFQGSPRYRPDGGPFQVDADEAERLVARLPPSDVLISHAPPRGVNDEPGDVAHTGFPGLLAWVQEHQPRWLLHGHTQPRPFGATTRIGATRVVHVHGSALVELHPVT